MNQDLEDLERLVQKISGNKETDFADIFVEEKTGTAIVFENGKIDRIKRGIDYGLGIRIIKKNRTFYGYSTQTDIKTVNELATSIKEAAGICSSNRDIVFP